MQGELLEACQSWSPLLPPWPMWRLLDSSQIDAAALLTFAVDGDNTVDAVQLAARSVTLLVQLVKVAGLSPEMRWQQPQSWSGVYGQRTAAMT